MKISIDSIKKPIDPELEQFEAHFRQAMRSPVPLLDKITYYIVRRKGKQMRPMFVFLCAKISGGVSEATFSAASLVELLHTATLVHDDVVDDSFERRGFFRSMRFGKTRLPFWLGTICSPRGCFWH